MRYWDILINEGVWFSENKHAKLHPMEEKGKGKELLQPTLVEESFDSTCFYATKLTTSELDDESNFRYKWQVCAS